MRSNGDGDVLLVHAKAGRGEVRRRTGYGVERFDVMYNDFVIVGPPTPTRRGSETALRDAKTARSPGSRRRGRPFASRGDDSGTHKKEMAPLEGSRASIPRPASGEWYRETGSGMGATLNTGVGMQRLCA